MPWPILTEPEPSVRLADTEGAKILEAVWLKMQETHVGRIREAATIIEQALIKREAKGRAEEAQLYQTTKIETLMREKERLVSVIEGIAQNAHIIAKSYRKQMKA